MKLTLLFLCLTSSLLSQSWVQLPDFPGTERDDGVAFVIHNKAYCLSGLDVNFQCMGNGFVFDGSTESWSSMASLPVGEERQYATAFAYAGNGYVVGGIDCNNVCLQDFWKYDPVTDAWTSLPDFPGVARQGMSSFIIKTKAYLTGGKLADGTILKEVWEYDFTSAAWTQKNDLPVNGMWRGSGFSVDTTGYIAYGMNNAQGYHHTMHAYDYRTDAWSQIAGIALPSRRYVGTAVCGSGVGLYGGQDSTGHITNELMVFDPADHSLTWKPGIPGIGRKGGMAFSLNGHFYTTTGVTNTARLRETWKAVGLVSLEEKSETEQVVLYPNPATDRLNISVPGIEGEKALVEIYNALGESIVSVPFSESLDISALRQGVYVLLLKRNRQILQARFIKN